MGVLHFSMDINYNRTNSVNFAYRASIAKKDDVESFKPDGANHKIY